MTCYRRYQSPLGELLLAAEGETLTGLWFAGQKNAPALPEGEVRSGAPAPQASDLRAASAAQTVLDRTAAWLDGYFSGRRPGVLPPLAPAGTAFQQTVWRLLLEIPYGQTLTYGALAARTGALLGVPRMSAQAVGGAVARNPISILIPCHRVVGSGGALTGYAGGLSRKAALLALEAGKQGEDNRQQAIGNRQ